ncbi:MAG: DoxX family protein [Rickettsiales bacterium]|nr:DoxX family protein [Rickettsiales bacterium]|tara:strand:- start:4314 stop:4709 length:396 start_codon:yes stop_codon:yes gene_type:complete
MNIQTLFGKLKPYSYFFLRIFLGIAFIIHGAEKLPLPPEKFMQYFNFGPLFSSFIVICEIFSGVFLIFAFFIKNWVGNLLTRFAAGTMIIIMICAFYLAHQDWFINTKLFTSEQIFLITIGFFFFINGNSQ